MQLYSYTMQFAIGYHLVLGYSEFLVVPKISQFGEGARKKFLVPQTLRQVSAND